MSETIITVDPINDEYTNPETEKRNFKLEFSDTTKNKLKFAAMIAGGTVLSLAAAAGIQYVIDKTTTKDEEEE